MPDSQPISDEMMFALSARLRTACEKAGKADVSLLSEIHSDASVAPLDTVPYPHTEKEALRAIHRVGRALGVVNNMHVHLDAPMWGIQVAFPVRCRPGASIKQLLYVMRCAEADWFDEHPETLTLRAIALTAIHLPDLAYRQSVNVYEVSQTGLYIELPLLTTPVRDSTVDAFLRGYHSRDTEYIFPGGTTFIAQLEADA